MQTRRWFCVSGLMVAGCGGWAQTPGPLRMSAPRAAHHVLAMADGSVLFIGGCVADSCETGPASSTVDRYDPAARQITPLGRLQAPRIDGAAAALPDGSVLLAGGWSGRSRSDLVERFDPRAGKSETVGRLSAPQDCSAVTLPDGRVVLMGERTVDAFDPQSATVRQITANSPSLDSSTTTLLDDGRILVAGGGISGPPVDLAYLFDPDTGKAETTGRLAAPRRKHGAARLPDGRVLLVGGSGAEDRRNKYRELEVYDPGAGVFSSVGETQEARFKIPDAVVLLGNGKVLVAGGADYPELIDPRDWSVRRVDVELGAMLNFSGAVLLASGDVLVAGGYGENTINPTDQVWIIPASALV